ncbi:hypothetical protein [Tepidiforma sp.]|uniref:hypothetical protein n=1 Tax=Tepidiforma sp. TaxID=2682230 RepID=UPI002ADDA3CB|nr:hypothetical protein [Tepidiforma sp.]
MRRALMLALALPLPFAALPVIAVFVDGQRAEAPETLVVDVASPAIAPQAAQVLEIAPGAEGERPLAYSADEQPGACEAPQS